MTGPLLVDEIKSLLAIADAQRDAECGRVRKWYGRPYPPLRKATDDGGLATDDQLDDDGESLASLYARIAAHHVAVARHFGSAVGHRAPARDKTTRSAARPEAPADEDAAALWRRADQGDLAARAQLDAMAKAAVSVSMHRPRLGSPGRR
jgi:hypothetical protein